MKLHFTKMQGCGNDYIYFNCFSQEINNPQNLSVKLSDRHYGIGGDGIILICPSEIADAKMRMFNADGSEGKMCGNGIRCVGRFLLENKMVNRKDITIETLSGIKSLRANFVGVEFKNITVDMGKAVLNPLKIPVNSNSGSVINIPIKIADQTYNITCVSIGNPHCVVFCDEIESLNLKKIGPLFENHELFPGKVNTEFVEMDRHSPKTLKMRVWERGSGETLACGTGACAAAVAATENGYFKKGDEINVKLRGGDLIIRYTERTVYMTGNAQTIFEGVVEI